MLGSAGRTWTVNRRASRVLLALALAVGATGAGAATASAAPTWLPSFDIGTKSTVAGGANDVVIDPNGNAVIVNEPWENPPCVQPCEGVEIVFRDASGALRVQRMSALGRDAFVSSIAMDAAGNTALVWQEQNAERSAYVIKAAYKPAAANAFQGPQTLSGAGAPARSPRVDIVNDHAVAVWVRGNIVQAAVKPPGSSQFGGADDLSASGGTSPAVAVDAARRAVVLWTRFDGANQRLQARARAANGDLSATEDVSAPGLDVYSPNLAMDPQGRATAVWYAYDGTNYVAQSAARNGTDLSSQFSPAQTLVNDAGSLDPGADSFDPQVAVDADNTAVAAWYSCRDSAPFGCFIQGAARNNNQSFAAAQTLSAIGDDSFSPRVVIDPNGTALVTWQGGTADGSAAFGSTRAKNGTFASTSIIEQFGNSTNSFVLGPVVAAFTPDGNAIASYGREVVGGSGSEYSGRVAGFDATGPQLRELAVPNQGSALTPLKFSVAPLDLWSPFSTRWEFGDGGVADGNSVAHAYAAPGAYTIRVTSTDAVGNATSESRTINVSAADRDGDGFPANQDCDDANPNIKPGAKEIPGNKIDENCDNVLGKPPVITAGITASWSRVGRRTTVTRMLVTGVIRGAKVQIRCKPRKKSRLKRDCGFKKRNVRVKKRKANVLRALRRKRTFVAGTRLEVRITKTGYIGKVVRYPMSARNTPRSRTFCLPLGSSKPKKKC